MDREIGQVTPIKKIFFCELLVIKVKIFRMTQEKVEVQ